MKGVFEARFIGLTVAFPGNHFPVDDNTGAAVSQGKLFGQKGAGQKKRKDERDGDTPSQVRGLRKDSDGSSGPQQHKTN